MNTNDTSLIISFVALGVSILAALFTGLQLHLFESQLKLEANSRIFDTTRELMSYGFQDSEFFQIFNGKAFSDLEKQRRYLQLWINHIFIIWDSANEGLISKSCWHAYTNDIKDFFSEHIIRSHWQEVKNSYPSKFCNFINSKVIKK